MVLSSVLDEKKDVGLVFPDYHHVDFEGNITETIRRDKIDGKDQVLDLPAHGACTMYRKEVLINLDSYDEEFSCQVVDKHRIRFAFNTSVLFGV